MIKNKLKLQNYVQKNNPDRINLIGNMKKIANEAWFVDSDAVNDLSDGQKKHPQQLFDVARHESQTAIKIMPYAQIVHDISNDIYGNDSDKAWKDLQKFKNDLEAGFANITYTLQV